MWHDHNGTAAQGMSRLNIVCSCVIGLVIITKMICYRQGWHSTPWRDCVDSKAKIGFALRGKVEEGKAVNSDDRQRGRMRGTQLTMTAGVKKGNSNGKHPFII